MRTAMALAFLLLALPGAAAAKGPMIGLDRYSSHVEPGEPWTATLVARGGYELPAGAPPPGLTVVAANGARHHAPGAPTGRPGVYRVEFDTLAAGSYRLETDDGYGGSFFLGSVRISEVAAREPAGDDGMGLVLPIAGSALLALVALLAVRRRRGGATSPRPA